jgi:hypothetical protein
MIRFKISAGDLPSAESILEVHRAEKGEDGDYLLGLAWLARGAALTGDWKAASIHAKSARDLRRQSSSAGDSNREAVYALGTAIEVQAQAGRVGKERGDPIPGESPRSEAPFNLRARI